MNKKAQTSMETPIWLWRISVTLFIILFFIFIIVSYSNENIQISNLENKITAKSLIYTDSCFAYNNGLMTNPNIIDINKFNDKRLMMCFNKKTIGVKCTLSSFDEKIFSRAKLVDSKLEPFLGDICDSIPEYKCSNFKEFIMIKDEEGLHPGILQVEVINNG